MAAAASAVCCWPSTICLKRSHHKRGIPTCSSAGAGSASIVLLGSAVHSCSSCSGCLTCVCFGCAREDKKARIEPATRFFQPGASPAFLREGRSGAEEAVEALPEVSGRVEGSVSPASTASFFVSVCAAGPVCSCCSARGCSASCNDDGDGTNELLSLELTGLTGLRDSSQSLSTA